MFSELTAGNQTGTTYYATGPQARQPEAAGDVLISGTPVGFDATAQPVTGITGIGVFARAWTWLAVTVSVFVFAGLLRRGWRVLLR